MKKLVTITLLIAMAISIASCGPKISNGNLNTSHLHIKYPQLKGLKNKRVQERINSQLYAIIFKLMDENNSEIKRLEDGYSYYSQYSVTRCDSDILSIRYDEMLSLPHYAHPLNQVNSLTINMKNGKDLKLSDIFPKESEWRAAINGMAAAKLAELSKKNGTSTLDDFNGISKDQGFYLTKRAVALYWQEATYFPRYLGPTIVLLPRSKLSSLLK